MMQEGRKRRSQSLLMLTTAEARGRKVFPMGFGAAPVSSTMNAMELRATAKLGATSISVWLS